MTDEGIKSAGYGDFSNDIEVKSFELLKHDDSEKYILSLSDQTSHHHRREIAYAFPPRLLEELARHTLRTVAPTTDDRILAALNRIEQILKQRE